jgi:DNA-binding response OmpR family regulator
MPKILVVEDDRNLAATVEAWLKSEAYSVEKAETGTDALELLQTYSYDVVVLDIQLPRLSGLEVLRRYREGGGGTPVLMLTNMAQLSDKEDGFDAGADDYLTKPFHLKELSARVRALLRRPANPVPTVLKAGAIELNSNTRTVSVAGKSVHVPKTEFSLLEFFMRHPNQVFSSEALLDRVWTADSERSAETIRSCIKKLRNKIDLPDQPSPIKNIHGIGYKFEM